ncbi:MAG: AEC family transporter [Clostridia bacterium]|nr:AEC family transporter [Clostridia bacterium]
MFLENLLIASKQVGILYVLVAIGFICDKVGIFKEKAAKLSNDLLFYIITPSVIVQSFLTVENSKENVKNLLVAGLLGVILHIIAIVISMLCFRKKNDENCIFKMATAYGNVGYMVLPLSQAILGDEGVFYCSAIVMVFNVLAFTHGVNIMSKQAKFEWNKLILNPGTIAILVGLPFFIFNIKLPEIINIPLDYVASLQTPLAMIFFGTYLANTDLKSMFNNKKIYLTALMKLIVIPLIMLVLMRLFSVGMVMMTAILISASAPSANLTVMLSAKYDKDVGLASKTVALISFISIITMPIIIAIGQNVN